MPTTKVTAVPTGWTEAAAAVGLLENSGKTPVFYRVATAAPDAATVFDGHRIKQGERVKIEALGASEKVYVRSHFENCGLFVTV